jgi:hypothetical protein
MLSNPNTAIVFGSIFAALLSQHISPYLYLLLPSMAFFIDEVTGARGADVRMALLELAGIKIELLQYDNIKQPEELSAPYIPGYAHLAFIVEDLDTLLSKVSEYGWKTPGKPQTVLSGPMQGTRVIYLQSPDGQTLELMERGQ